jgi:lysophospholipase L1-like esterase
MRRIIPSTILSPTSQTSRAQIVSGQGQRAYPGRGTVLPLEARLIPGIEQPPLDRIGFRIPNTGFCDPTYAAHILYGRIEVIQGDDPQITPGGVLAVKPINGIVKVNYFPDLPITWAVAIGATRLATQPQAMTNNDYFIIGAPRTYLARKKFARDPQGNIIRDSSGNATPTNEFEEIPPDASDANKHEPFVNVADLWDKGGQVQEPNDVFKVWVELLTADYGQSLDAGVLGISDYREHLIVPDGYALPSTELTLTKIEAKENGMWLYRSDPIAVIATMRTNTAIEQISNAPGNVHVMQADLNSVIAPYVPFTLPAQQEPQRMPGAARPVQTHNWVFTGDSITMGTQATVVVGSYQKASYAYQTSFLSNVFCRAPIIPEFGTPHRRWLDPNYTARYPLQNPRLYLEYFKYAPGYQMRSPASEYRFANIVGIHGVEARHGITLGRGGAVWSGDFRSDFTNEATAGLEPPGYDDWYNEERWLTYQVTAKNTYVGSQAQQAKLSGADLVSIFLGNNDSLQAVLQGDTMQAYLTPFDTFDVATHRSALQALAPVRVVNPTIPVDSNAVPAGLTSIGVVTFKDSLDRMVSDVKNIPLRPGPGTRDPDIVIATLPDTTKIPILIPLRDGLTLRHAWGDANRFPYAVNLFGVDVTDDFLDSMVLSDFVIGTEQRHPAGTLVPLNSLLGYFAWRLEKALPPYVKGVVLDESFSKVTAALFTNENDIRAAIRPAIQQNWASGIKPSVMGPNNPFSFRNDQVLTPAEVATIQSRIAAYNTHVANVCAAGGYAKFDVAAIFDQAATAQGFTVRNDQGAAIDTLRTTYRGKMFSLDGGHPGSFGHIVLASELMECLRAYAATRPGGKVGGVHFSDLSRVHGALLTQIRDTEDEAIKGAAGNP